jgi:hypothetical protein
MEKIQTLCAFAFAACPLVLLPLSLLAMILLPPPKSELVLLYLTNLWFAASILLGAVMIGTALDSVVDWTLKVFRRFTSPENTPERPKL